jgi:DNA-binding NtrC family response regulator
VKGRVLVIDDEPALRQTLERALRFFQYEVRTAADPDSAYALLNEMAFDVILLDLRLKHTLSDAFYIALMHQWPYLRGRVVLMSGDPYAVSAVWPQELRACPMLVKPFELEALADAVAARLIPRGRKYNGTA